MRSRLPAAPTAPRSLCLRTSSLIGLVALLTLAACGDPGETPKAAPAPAATKRPVPTATPSVILIGLAGVRFDDVHVPAGSKDAPRMPTFAAFARDHTDFLEAQSTAAWEVPSVASVLTGTIPSNSGVRGAADASRPVMIPANDSIAEMLQREGYDTAAFVPGGVLTFANQLDQGFEGAWTEGSRLEAGGPEAVATWLAARPKGKPFCLLVLGDATLPPVPADVADANRAAWAVNAHEARVEVVDRGLAALLAVLEKAALAPDTITVLFSDHGDALLERSSPAILGRGGGLFEEQVHVPFAISAPGVLGKGAVRGSCSLVDVLPTVRDAMGLPPGNGVSGRSLRPLATDPSASGLPAIAEEWRRVATDSGPVEHRLYAVRTAAFKWVADFVDRPPTWTEALFDLSADPQERNPLDAKDLARTSKEFAAQVEIVRDVLRGTRRHLTNEIVSGYVAGASGSAPKKPN